MKTPLRWTAAVCITPSRACSVLDNSSSQQWKNTEISVNKPVCVLSQPLDFLPFLSPSRLCKSSAGALQPGSGAESSTSSQLCAGLSAVCCSQELAGNQFKMFHFQTPPHNPWISLFTLTEAVTGLLTALHSLLGEQGTSPMFVTHFCNCHPRTEAKVDPNPSSSSYFLALLSHHPTFFSVHSFILRATDIVIHLIQTGHAAGHHRPAFHTHHPHPTASPWALPLSHPLLEDTSHRSTVPRAEKNPLTWIS